MASLWHELRMVMLLLLRGGLEDAARVLKPEKLPERHEGGIHLRASGWGGCVSEPPQPGR